jgi:hypothetical protein
MTNDALQNLKYPIGAFEFPEHVTKTLMESWISILEHFPERLENLVKNLSDEQLNTPYRPEGWTVRQTIHHISDSHLHSYARFKWALTEDKPVIKAYFEDRLADLEDSKNGPINLSINHIKAIHSKLVYLLKGLCDADFNKVFIHPDTKKEVSLKRNLGIYAWHSNHHYTHIENLLKRNNWL